MTLFETAALIAAAVNLVLAFFVYQQDVKLPLHRAYLLWAAGVAIWNISTYFMYQQTPPLGPEFWAKVLQFGIIIAPIGFLHTSMYIAETKLPRSLAWFFYLLHAGFIAALSTDWFITGVRQIPYGYWAKPGPLFAAYVVSYLIIMVGSFVVLYRAQRVAQRLARRRIRTMLLASFCIWPAGTNDLLPILGFDYYPFTDIPFYPLGNFASCIYMTIVAYSVLQHSLLDVHVALSRFAAHAVRILLITLIGFCLLLLLNAVAPQKFTSFAFYGSLGTLLASAVIASVLFPRLLGGGADSFERRLLGDRFEYQDKVRTFIEGMSWYGDLNALFRDLHELLLLIFRLGSYHIILRDETTRGFTLFRAHPDEPSREVTELKAQSPIFQHFEWDKAEYLALNPNYVRASRRRLEQQAREQVAAFNAELCFPLTAESEPFGLMLVGAKSHGEPFTATDINLLVALVKNLSLMVNQIRLKNQILQAQELDLLGRMSRGMAHDLNNLLTPVWTLLQLSNEGGGTLVDEELLPVAMRNLKTMRAYIKEALFFSENLRPDLQLGRLDLVLKQAADLARASRKKEIELVANIPDEVLVEMDEVLMQRLLANLISNAIDASTEGARVEVHLDRLARTDANRDWVRARIVDHGEGIPKENLSRILTPYFTTKNRGDENRGFGLGLAICRKIVNLHGGQLNISSQVRRGTTVQVDLPTRQMRPAVPLPATSVS